MRIMVTKGIVVPGSKTWHRHCTGIVGSPQSMLAPAWTSCTSHTVYKIYCVLTYRT